MTGPTKLCSLATNVIILVSFLGLHEVARELENPMWNAPNDLPLTTFQAQFNEAIVTMYAGYHPDSWWHIKDHDPDSPSSKKDSLKAKIK